MLEVVQQRYAPEAFHDFIGFQVAKPVFERAFLDTYGLPLNQVLTKEDLAIGTYRKTVSTLLPKMTQVAVADYGKQMQQAEPTFVPKKLIYRAHQGRLPEALRQQLPASRLRRSLSSPSC